MGLDSRGLRGCVQGLKRPLGPAFAQHFSLSPCGQHLSPCGQHFGIRIAAPCPSPRECLNAKPVTYLGNRACVNLDAWLSASLKWKQTGTQQHQSRWYMSEASFAFRRANPRFAFFAEAEATLRDGTQVPAQVSELSSRGCYIDTLEPIPIGTEVRLRISNGASSCEVPGKVIYMHSGYGMGIFGMGVVFGNVASDQPPALNQWLPSPALPKTTPPPRYPHRHFLNSPRHA